MQRCKRNQKTAGGGSRAFNNALPRRPRTPLLFYGGHHQERGKYPSGAGKAQNGYLSADRCRSVPVEQPPAPTRSDAPNFPPSRRARVDGSAAGTCAGFAGTRRKTHLRPSVAPASAICHLLRWFPTEPSRAPPTPGGTSNRGPGTQWKPSKAGSIGRGRLPLSRGDVPKGQRG